MRYRYIAVEGNIGAGKSTLAELIARHYGANLILEEFADNTFLPKFYEDPERYAFPLELSFLADRYMQLKQTLLNGDMLSEKVVSDYTFMKSKLFAQINLKGGEYELFQKLFDIIDLQLPAPDLLIYLHSPVAKLQQNIQMRGRAYEQHIPDSYLEQVQGVYQQYLKQQKSPTLVVDTSVADFLNHATHFNQLISFLEKDYNFSLHHLLLEDS